MKIRFQKNVLKKGRRAASLLFAGIMFLGTLPLAAAADNGKTEVPGSVYEFGKDSHYEFHENADAVSSENFTYGTFSIGGSISDVTKKDGVPAYQVSEGNLSFFYNYGDTLLHANEDDWHLIDDKSKKVADITLNSNIMKGAIILQTSKDRKNWIDVGSVTNAFSNIPIQTSSIYSTTDVQLMNGCFYRVIVVYELCVRTEDSKFLFINTDKHEYKKYAEVYEFYAYTGSGAADVVDSEQTYNLGSKVRAKNFDGYSGETTIDKKDDHYGWELGRFFVSGYTDEVANADGNMVFLKNVGDKVTLWFKLNENINALRGNKNLTITADTESYDQYFETPRMNFGRGTLIIRYTDHNNVSAEPVIYTNFLDANTTVGADTQVHLFEEGDYEVALDYEITNDKLIDRISHYRIFFQFSVRNGNCMVYPFDVASGSELSNSSMTENGFRLDLAKSRYLKVNIKREVLKDSADGLIEDTRFNGPAKDGAQYTDEGIYTITVHNEYTDQFTVKKIYVGSNSVLRAYMATGLSIPEINELVSQGATIAQDGTIQLSSIIHPTEAPEQQNNSERNPVEPSDPEDSPDNNSENSGTLVPIFPLIGVVAVIVLIGAIVFVRKKHTTIQRNNNEKERSKEP